MSKKQQTNFVFKRTPGITKVLSHLRAHKDGITPLEALGVYGIYRLGSAIHILRQRGHLIETRLMRDDNGRSYARYKMLRKAAA